MKRFENKIWLASPTMHGDELKYMQEAYDTNWMSTIGRNINEIELSLSKQLHDQYALALSSGTASLHLAVKLAGVKQGDYVFCQDLTFAATVNPVIYEKAIPVFIDSEKETWNMDPKALEKAFELYPNTKVVIVVNLYGTPAKLDEIKEICKKHNAILIEDAAESLGASYKEQQTGSFGDINIISFNGNKIITGSSGGMLLTKNKELADKARKWATQARENAPWYQHEDIGYNYRMSNVIAGVIRGQIPYLEEHLAKKKEIYNRYKEGLKGLPVQMNPYLEDSNPNFWLSCLTINKEAMCQNDKLDLTYTYKKEHGKTCPMEILDMFEKYNVEGRPIWKPMHMQPIYKEYSFISINDVIDEDIFERGLCLPSDIKMTEEEQNQVIEIIRKCFE